MKIWPVYLLLAAVLTACTDTPSAGQTVQNQPSSAAQVPTLIATVAAQPTSQPITAPAPTAVPTLAPTVALPTSQPTRISEPTSAPISGLVLARGAVTARLNAVMIDNHPNAYPQTGLDGAVVVFEALAEFGITRYMAIFADGFSPNMQTIGPVRSARPYFVEWAKGLGASYIHAGGSPEGLLLAETAIEIVNMDALRRDGGKFFRRSAERAAPHNLYTSSADIAAFVQQQASTEPDYRAIGFLYKAEAAPTDRPASQSLRYFFIYPEQSVGWSYDAQQNDYLRFRGTRPYIDARTGEQLRFTNLLILEVPEAPIPGDPKGRIEQQVIGQGPGRLFLDGVQREIVWRKDAGFAPLSFYLPSGEEIALNPGTTWIAAVPSLQNLTVEGGN